jgi:apolipoprotein N-acyltransferase
VVPGTGYWVLGTGYWVLGTGIGPSPHHFLRSEPSGTLSVSTLLSVRSALFALVGGGLTVLGFQPFGMGVVVVAGVALFLVGVRLAGSGGQAVLVGMLYGLAFWGGLMWWLAELHWTALTLAPVQAVFPAALAWWLHRHRQAPAMAWVTLATGGWAVMELLRYRIPVGGQEWGALGYSLAGVAPARNLASIIGTSGLTVLLAGAGAAVAREVARESSRTLRHTVGIGLLATLLLSVAGGIYQPVGDPIPVAIVQGSTPCPFEDCPPNERLRTFLQHLELTGTIEPGSVRLVVWPESSSGSVNADPVANPEIGAMVAAEARRLGAWMMIGSDRPLSDTHWVNANVVFDPEGVVVGEYQKQHPVPFGEYVPFRSFFTRLIPELRRVPRDMIPGEGPVVFDLGGVDLGTVISWEGGFARYARHHAALGAEVLVVATNNDSYGPEAPTSDQFMAMTRMRAAELGLPVIHAAVTGKSVLISRSGEFVVEPSRLGDSTVIYGEIAPSVGSVYGRTGDLVMVTLAAVGAVTWWRQRSSLVPSPIPQEE